MTELRFISQPPNEPEITQIKDYVYAQSIKETFVYYAGVGINKHHSDFDNRNIEWVYTVLARHLHKDTQTDEDEEFGSGTCIASKAVGTIYGAAKEQTLVVVKMPDYTLGSVCEVLDTAFDHIVAFGRQRRIVVLISWPSSRNEASGILSDPFWNIIRNTIARMLQMNIKVICGAGDYAIRGDRLIADTAPAIYARFMPLLVSSSCDNNGRRSPTSQEAPRGKQLYAPGVGVTCADSHTATAVRIGSGTWAGE